MATQIFRTKLTSIWSEEVKDVPDEPISNDTIPQIFEEVRKNYNLNEGSPSPEQRNIRDEDEPIEVLNEAINNMEGANTPVRSCASCSEVKRVEDVTTFAKAQHLSMPGQKKNKYDRAKRKLKHPYKHHAIVKEVISASGMIAVMVLIHFTAGSDGKRRIYQTTETFDLRQDEIYHVKYVHPRYEADEIVRRAESMLPKKNRSCESQFDSYNLFKSNCEHFATWCVVDEGDSFQVQGCQKIIAESIKNGVGSGSVIAKGVLRILVNSADEITSALSSTINVPDITLGATTGIYLIYCIVMTVQHVKEYIRGHMCRSCLKGKLKDLWLTFGAIGVTSVLTFVVLNFAVPLLPLCPFGVPLVILLMLLSLALQWSIPKIRRSLQSPFNVDRKKISTLSSVNIGDIISFYYYGFEHVAVVTEVNDSDPLVSCVHYSLPSLFGTRVVREETFNLDPSKHTVKLFDCSHLQCKPRDKVVEHARRRVNETKWSPLNRSDHLCLWAKVKANQRGPCESDDNIEMSGSSIKTTAFIRDEHVHLMTDLQLGDVVVYGRKGILVGIRSLDQNYGRNFEIEMMVYSSSWYIRKRKYDIDLNKHKLKVKLYHPAHCYPMSTRVDRALAMEDKKPECWTTENFIMDCIMRQKT